MYEQAWNDVYDHIAGKMIAGAAEDTDPPYWHAEVIRHERRGSDIAVFACRPLQPLTFRAGQYVSIECRYQPRLWRTYSMANAPRADGTLDFHVRAVGGGWVSSALVHRLRAGDMLRIAAPMGSMTLDPQSRRDIVLRHRRHRPRPDQGAAGGADPVQPHPVDPPVPRRAAARRLLRPAAPRSRSPRAFPWLTIVRAVSDEPGGAGERGAIPDVLSRHGPWRDHDFYVAGSAGMVNATLRRLAEMRIPSTRIKYDAFTDA